MAKAEKLRNKSDSELLTLVGELKKQLFDEKNRRLLDKEAKSASTNRAIKREIAQAKTILREKELETTGI